MSLERDDLWDVPRHGWGSSPHADVATCLPSPRTPRTTSTGAVHDNLILLLDACFVHRTRAREGKDGNPLNEVRMLCNSILRNAGVLGADKTIKYEPETSVLKLRIGDEIALDEGQIWLLSDAFFAEIQHKFS
jgi:hypothetical protein